MVRVLIGSIVAAVVMFILGFVFYASPLAGIHVDALANAQAATVQQTLSANIPATGTYIVPDPGTSEQTVMYGQGPIATIHYNSGGFATTDAGALIGGLVLDFITALLMGAALIGIDRRVPDFGSRARVVVLFSGAASAYMHLIEPIMYHHGWGHFIYLFLADFVTLSAAGLVIARWFLPVKAER